MSGGRRRRRSRVDYLKKRKEKKGEERKRKRRKRQRKARSITCGANRQRRTRKRAAAASSSLERRRRRRRRRSLLGMQPIVRPNVLRTASFRSSFSSQSLYQAFRLLALLQPEMISANFSQFQSIDILEFGSDQMAKFNSPPT